MHLCIICFFLYISSVYKSASLYMSFMFFQTYDVYYLSEDLRKIPPQAVDIYLCRLQPTDLDKYWSDAANKLVCNWLLETQSAIDNYGENHYLVGHVSNRNYFLYIFLFLILYI